MKNLKLLLLILLPCTFLFSQNEEIGKLKNRLNIKIHDTVRCQIYQELAELCDDNEWPKYNKKLHDLALANLNLDNKLTKKYTVYLIKSLNNTGYLNHYLGKVEAAKTYHVKALQYAEQIGDLSSKSEVYNHLGYIAKGEGDISKALEYYGKSVRIEESLNKLDDLNYTYNNIGVIHFNMGDEEKALYYFNKGYKIQESLKDSLAMAHSLINFGSIYLKQKKYKEAEQNLKKSVAIMTILNENSGLAIAQNYLGNVLLNMNKLDSALYYCRKSLAIQEKLKEKRGLANVQKNIANIYLKKNDFKLARFYAKRSFADASSINNLEILKEVTFILYSISKKEGKLGEALRHYESYNQYKEQIVNEENKKKTYQLHLQYEYDKKSISDSINFAQKKQKDLLEFRNKEKLQKLENENLERKNFFQIIMLVLFLVLLIASILFTQFYVKKFKEKNSLSLQLNESLKERDLLNKEIHHRVKNNLQIISSLLNMQKMDQTDESVKDILQQSQNRIQSMALIHEKLYQSGNLKDVKLDEYLNTLMEYFAFNYDFKVKNVAYEIDIPSLQINTDQLIPLGLIANEIILNSLKYAFGENVDNQLGIKGVVEDSFLNLTFFDNGNGLPDDWAERSKKSLGTTLIKGLTRQLKGKIEFISEHGTKIKINIPID
jgi:two-component sensor histidine kinase/tetratricopeptide (TPR) repeat protein